MSGLVDAVWVIRALRKMVGDLECVEMAERFGRCVATKTDFQYLAAAR